LKTQLIKKTIIAYLTIKNTPPFLGLFVQFFRISGILTILAVFTHLLYFLAFLIKKRLSELFPSKRLKNKGVFFIILL
jgi:hypothetical protein